MLPSPRHCGLPKSDLCILVRTSELNGGKMLKTWWETYTLWVGKMLFSRNVFDILNIKYVDISASMLNQSLENNNKCKIKNQSFKQQ